MVEAVVGKCILVHSFLSSLVHTYWIWTDFFVFQMSNYVDFMAYLQWDWNNIRLILAAVVVAAAMVAKAEAAMEVRNVIIIGLYWDFSALPLDPLIPTLILSIVI